MNTEAEQSTELPDARLEYYARKIVKTCEWASIQEGRQTLPLLVSIEFLMVFSKLDRWKACKGLSEALAKGWLTLDDQARIVVVRTK